jgi:ADP-heptose:LPS heptosyltransferase
VRNGALGDFVLTLPLLRALAARGPVDVCCALRHACLLPLDVEHPVRRVDDAWLWRGAAPPAAYALAVAFSAPAADALRRCGLRDVRERAPRPAAGVHAVSHALAALDPALEHAPPVAPRIGCDEVRRRAGLRGDDGFARAARGRFVLAPGSGGPAKRWPLDRWRAVARELGNDAVVWVRGPVEEEEEHWPDEALSPDLPGLSALAEGARAWVGPDAGPSHLAAALGCPTLVVFGPTDAASWAPVGGVVLPWDVAPETIARAARAHARPVG